MKNKLFVGLVLLFCCLTKSHAALISTSDSILVNSSVGNISITTFYCSFDESTCVDVLDDQLWWGNSVLAEELVDLVGDVFGALNPFPGSPYTIYFAFAAGSPGLASGCELSLRCYTNLTSGSSPRYWAVIDSSNASTVSEPPLIGLMGMFFIALVTYRKKSGLNSTK